MEGAVRSGYQCAEAILAAERRAGRAAVKSDVVKG
jgi:hypothetical protein